MSDDGNEPVLPMTIGMLTSAIMRYNHGLFAPWFPDDAISRLQGPPEKRIQKAINKVAEMYADAVAGQPADAVTERQVREEFAGKIGFWRPEREDSYADMLAPYNLTTYAQQCVERLNKTTKQET